MFIQILSRSSENLPNFGVQNYFIQLDILPGKKRKKKENNFTKADQQPWSGPYFEDIR